MKFITRGAKGATCNAQYFPLGKFSTELSVWNKVETQSWLLTLVETLPPKYSTHNCTGNVIDRALGVFILWRLNLSRVYLFTNALHKFVIWPSRLLFYTTWVLSYRMHVPDLDAWDYGRIPRIHLPNVKVRGRFFDNDNNKFVFVYV